MRKPQILARGPHFPQLESLCAATETEHIALPKKYLEDGHVITKGSGILAGNEGCGFALVGERGGGV